MIPLLPGDGIGPAVIAEAVGVLRAVGFAEELRPFPFGRAAFEATGAALPAETVAAVRARGVALMGAATTGEEGPPSPVLALRRALGLDLLVRPVRGPGVDLVVVGHAFLGLYGQAEEADASVRRAYDPAAVEAVVAEGFRRARRRVVLVDKPVLWRRAAALWRAAAARHAGALPWELVNVDALCAELVRRPERHDVLVADSLFSDLLSDLAAGLVGGVGDAASASLGPGVAVFEPVHGSAPRRAQERPLCVSPLGAIRAAALLLCHLGERDRAARVEAAVDRVRAEASRGGVGVGEAVGPTTAQLGAAVRACL